jgi:SAM-dependent methyltransferase
MSTAPPLTELASVWEAHAECDPLWAVLSINGRDGRQWDIDEFYATGVRDVADLSARLRESGLPSRFRSALDFGCGVGRITEALAKICGLVVGVDVSPTMIALARSLSVAPSSVSYVLNQRDSLDHLGQQGFDLVHSRIVLQHVGESLALGYIRELAELVAPGGVMAIQLPTALRSGRGPTPLTEGSHRSTVEIANLPSQMTPGETVVLTARITNRSPHPWPRPPDGSPTHLVVTGAGERVPVTVGDVAIGSRWLRDGAYLPLDDGRRSPPAPDRAGRIRRCRPPRHRARRPRGLEPLGGTRERDDRVVR